MFGYRSRSFARLAKAGVLATMSLLAVLQPSPAFAEIFQRVYVGYVKVKDTGSIQITPAQRQLLDDLMKAIVLALKKGVRVKVDSPWSRDGWFMDRDWKEIAGYEKTHYLIAIPEVQQDSVLGAVIKISWEVGAIGTIDGEKVPVFAGALSEALETIIFNKPEVGAFIADSNVKERAAAIGVTMRAIFLELDPAPFRYYVNCFEIDRPPPDDLAKAWPERRELLLTRLLSQLSARIELQHSRSGSIDPRDEARSVCRDEADKRADARDKADFLIRGETSIAEEKFMVRVRIDNKPGARRLHNERTNQPNALSPDFYEKVVNWAYKYEGNIPWDLSVCGRNTDFWGMPPRVDPFADALAAIFQEKLAIEATAAVDRRSCQ